jgi:hypothetical protein
VDAEGILVKALAQVREIWKGQTRMGTHLALLLIGLTSGAFQSSLIAIAGTVGLLFDYRWEEMGQMGILSELLLNAASPTQSRSAYATGVGNPHRDIDGLDDPDHPTPSPQCHQCDSAFL